MSDTFVEGAKAQMGAVEAMLKGLPGVKGYVEKELRRDADYRVRTMIAGQLDEQKQRLFDIQQKLLKGGGLKWLDDVDGAIQKLQILSDRVRTASQGYAGLFDAVRIGEEQLDALHAFDVALVEQVARIKNAVDGLAATVGNHAEMGQTIETLTETIAAVGTLFGQRDQVLMQQA